MRLVHCVIQGHLESRLFMMKQQSMKLVILETFKWSSFGLLKATKLVIIRPSVYNFSMNTKPGNTAFGVKFCRSLDGHAKLQEEGGGRGWERSLGLEGRVPAVLYRLLRGAGQCLEVPFPRLPEWRRGLPHRLHYHTRY